jgi:hypothetical protein
VRLSQSEVKRKIFWVRPSRREGQAPPVGTLEGDGIRVKGIRGTNTRELYYSRDKGYIIRVSPFFI